MWCIAWFAGLSTLPASLSVGVRIQLGGSYKSNIVGAPRQCAEAIALFAELFVVEEVFVTTFVSEARARRYLYRTLAEEWSS